MAFIKPVIFATAVAITATVSASVVTIPPVPAASSAVLPIVAVPVPAVGCAVSWPLHYPPDVLEVTDIQPAIDKQCWPHALTYVTHLRGGKKEVDREGGVEWKRAEDEKEPCLRRNGIKN